MKIKILPMWQCLECFSIPTVLQEEGQAFCPNDKCKMHKIKYKFPTIDVEVVEEDGNA